MYQNQSQIIMLIGLATLLIILFSEGPEEVFLVSNAEKNLKLIIGKKVYLA